MTSPSLFDVCITVFTLLVLFGQCIISIQGMLNFNRQIEKFNLSTISIWDDSYLHLFILPFVVHPHWYGADPYRLMIFKTVEWRAYKCVHMSQNVQWGEEEI